MEDIYIIDEDEIRDLVKGGEKFVGYTKMQNSGCYNIYTKGNIDYDIWYTKTHRADSEDCYTIHLLRSDITNCTGDGKQVWKGNTNSLDTEETVQFIKKLVERIHNNGGEYYDRKTRKGSKN